jgi:Dolichyl-phosphate-mannose-protein mannosyltransferase
VKSLLMVIGIALLLRIGLSAHQGLWADELFSLAIATGHSLEHPAKDAVPALGDFVEPPRAEPAAAFQRYLAHESPPAGLRRVLRAVLLSDTSPPLYYLLLGGWTLAAGTSDLSVHAFSAVWALATLPLIWLLGRRVGPPRAAITATLLFAVAPVSLYYSVEVRMYALLWFQAALTAWLTFRLYDQGGLAALAGWILASAAGLLTHYFYAFVWAACVLWLVLRRGRCSRGQLAMAVLATVLLVAPWYRLVPESLARWRVTGQWLTGLPSVPKLLAAPLVLGWSLVSGRGVWGGHVLADRAGALVVLAAGLPLLRGGRAALFGNGRDLLWLSVVAACTGPVVFDVLRGTAASQISRYALAGVPAAMLLVALALAALPPRPAMLATALLILTWLPGLRDLVRHRSRAGEPYREVAERVGAWVRPNDLVLVHSIPSGVLGIARYLPADVPMAAWVGQLGRRRVPDDLLALLAGRSRVAFVRLHEVGEPAPEEVWLRTHATVLRAEQHQSATLAYFELAARPPVTRR